jgi:hypothetical protein
MGKMNSMDRTIKSIWREADVAPGPGGSLLDTPDLKEVKALLDELA